MERVMCYQWSKQRNTSACRLHHFKHIAAKQKLTSNSCQSSMREMNRSRKDKDGLLNHCNYAFTKQHHKRQTLQGTRNNMREEMPTLNNNKNMATGVTQLDLEK